MADNLNRAAWKIMEARGSKRKKDAPRQKRSQSQDKRSSRMRNNADGKKPCQDEKRDHVPGKVAGRPGKVAVGLGAVVRCCQHGKMWTDVESSGKLMQGLERAHKVTEGRRMVPSISRILQSLASVSKH